MLNNAQNNVIIYDMNTNRRTYINDPQRLINTATPSVGRRIAETGATPSPKEIQVIDWLENNVGGNITVLAEQNKYGVKNPDLLWDNSFVDIKHTAGTWRTLDTHVKKAMTQTNRGGVIVDVSGTLLSDEEVVNTVMRRLRNSMGEFAIVIKNNEILAYIYQK